MNRTLIKNIAALMLSVVLTACGGGSASGSGGLVIGDSDNDDPTANAFQVTPSVIGSGSISPSGPQTVDEGQSIQFTLTADTGFELSRVQGTCGGTVELGGTRFTTDAITANCTVEAVFEQIPSTTFTVTPSVIGSGSISPASPQTVDEGQSIQFTLTADTGFELSRVQGTCGGTVELGGTRFTTDAITANCTVEAVFEAIPSTTFTVTPSVIGSGSITPTGPQTVDEGQSIQFTLTADTGFELSRVQGNCGGTVELGGTRFTTDAITANCTVEAVFEAIPSTTFTVTPSVIGSGSISPSGSQTVGAGQSIQFTLTADTGFELSRVQGTCGGTVELGGTRFTTDAINANCSVEAVFEQIPSTTFTVTPSVIGSGSISPTSPQTVDEGQSIQFTLTADSGYELSDVQGTCGGTVELGGTRFTTDAVNANCTVEAVFEEIPATTFTVTPSVIGSGSISPSSPQTVDEGQSIQFTLIPDAGYQLNVVQGTCGGSVGFGGTRFTTNAISADCTVEAVFEVDSSFTFEPGMFGLTALALSLDETTAFVMDDVDRALIAIDLATQQRTLISDINTGVGPDFSSPRGLVLNAAEDRAFVVDPDLDAMISINLSTGDRTIISGTSNPSTSFIAPREVVLNAAEDTAFVMDADLDALLSVNLATGDRTIISDGSNSGTNFSYPEDLVLNSAEDTAFVMDLNRRALISVNLATGDRNIVSDNNSLGEDFSKPRKLALNALEDTAFVVDFGLAALLSVNLTTGERTVVSNSSGQGEDFVRPFDLVLNAAEDTAFVVDNELNALLSVNLTTGERVVLLDSSVGAGDVLDEPAKLASNIAEDTAYVMDENEYVRALIRVNLETGERTTISNFMNLGTNFTVPVDVALNAAEDIAFVLDKGVYTLGAIVQGIGLPALISVDLGTGDRTVVSDDETPGGNEFRSPLALALNASEDTAFVVDSNRNALISVNMTTGLRTIVSDSNNLGGNFSTPAGLTLNALEDTAFVVDSGLDALISVNLATGERTVVSDSNSLGEGFHTPVDLALNAAEDTAFVVDSGLGALISVDLTTGNRTILSSHEVGLGNNLVSPEGLVLNASEDTVLISDSGLRSILSIDLATGNRTLISH